MTTLYDEAAAPRAATASILQADDLIVRFSTRHGSVTALDHVSIDIAPGASVGLIGESGSGKTTLTRCLLGLIPPENGTVRFRGEDVYALKQADRFHRLSRDIALVFQDPRSSLNPRLSVGAVVRDPLTVLGILKRGQRRARVAELLESVGLAPTIADRPVRSLSGGQLQRVAIARALAVEPSLVIADEPTSALDVSVQGEILNLLKDLCRQRDLALLLVSHDMRVVRYMTDRTIVMQHGRIVETGPTQQVHECPQDDYTKALLAASPTLPTSGTGHLPAAAPTHENRDDEHR